MYYHRCKDCGSYLDPGEKCDCQEAKVQKERVIEKMLEPSKSGQMVFRFAKENEYEKRLAQ